MDVEAGVTPGRYQRFLDILDKFGLPQLLVATFALCFLGLEIYVLIEQTPASTNSKSPKEEIIDGCLATTLDGAFQNEIIVGLCKHGIHIASHILQNASYNHPGFNGVVLTINQWKQLLDIAPWINQKYSV